MKLSQTRWLALAACGMLLVSGCGGSSDDQADDDKPLMVHVGGTMQPVMAELAERYEKQSGVKVDINTAGSGELLAHIESQKEGDFYVCHDPFLPLLMKRGLGVDGWVVAHITPVIVVRPGNPQEIKGVKDLATRTDLDVWLTDYEKSSLGWMLPTIFKKVGVDFKVVKKAKHIKTSRKGGQVANRVKTGNADAAMCWNAVAFLRKPDVDVIELPDAHLPIPGVDTVTSATGKDYPLTPMRVTLATLKCSKQPEKAAKFAAFMAGAEARKVFGEFGFTMCEARKLYEGGKKTP